MPGANPERDEEIWYKHIRGQSRSILAREYGVSHQAISQAIARHRATIPPHVKEEFVQGELDLARRLRNEMLALADMNGIPVTAGKDGNFVVDPETGQVARDYGGRIAAHRAALGWTERLARLTGADAPTQINLTASEASEADKAAAEAKARLRGEETQ